MAKVLSACRTGRVLLTRTAILKCAGYEVIAATTVGAALAALQLESIKVAVIGHLYTTDEKNTIAAKAHQVGAKVLCVHDEPEPPEVVADDFIFNLDRPELLLSRVAALLDAQRQGAVG